MIDIKTLMFKNKINQKEFAKFCGVSLRTISTHFNEDIYDEGNGLPEKTARLNKNIKKLAKEFSEIHNLK